ncbi:3-hydroxyacyl-ACP dehydratase FabZ family protein [Flavobacterium johnsoniae]|uniref:Beta-hydroxyacyl-(Acyl-carrier-protein) dehydratase, FabA/FabZ n=1 Tax=Flavobacterium johnsoniae (strain ATCC 17061 / DSM 2064 / JCM 8514 / BCRC 14874 / CCUG 350202 / NBRC 14942 / NCIMB 11054 / UW101) TaxID=376686 RepID=A5FDA3_FLAJ1|nr:hydroxymyristoyl-ACP dehydratase [Flavobacterium johnsoniae]ABQ06820.1 Beta-hydroxyacyl-(acyl-carrier-protein) dehydratase, FabA/FabZ [Flavobacterium johnsoniae UW101]OXE97315.1 hydroxymyristoyl-ACP dehydratase [Flavobacterium johnsoniae UW101]WQG81347.1 hydroxymyristoyl-ACP dehydratase [Flavobacterium johnsoniae UW101]SHL39635.1 3-hydroxyacyl-[acyl-carrier-protein] dehydratase [Flavobacterium johnsoniae]
MTVQDIIIRLPYSKPFLFVDELLDVNENSITGTYTFKEDLDFYRGHFKGNHVTPGVILTETMAQIGMVCLGIYLLGDAFNKDTVIAFTSADMQFLKPVYPNEKVTVTAQKSFFRFGKLKCDVIMKNQAGQEVCKGILSGMITNKL